MCLLPVIATLNFAERHGEWCSGCLHGVLWTDNDMNAPGSPFASLNRHGSEYNVLVRVSRLEFRV